MDRHHQALGGCRAALGRSSRFDGAFKKPQKHWVGFGSAPSRPSPGASPHHELERTCGRAGRKHLGLHLRGKTAIGCLLQPSFGVQRECQRHRSTRPEFGMHIDEATGLAHESVDLR
jgi:hypothetical protein